MTTINEALQFGIKNLRLSKYLERDSFKGGTLYWKLGAETTASIRIEVNTFSENPYLELNYQSNQTPVNYRVRLLPVPSNLGKGVVWFFLCPSTGKRCRKLYLADQYFVSRFAFGNVLYEQQTKSHKARRYNKAFNKLFKGNELHQMIQSRHFKTHYSGKPTKRYMQLLKRINRSEMLTTDDLQTLFW